MYVNVVAINYNGTNLIELGTEFQCQRCSFLDADLSTDLEVWFVSQQNDGHIDGSANFTDAFEILFSQKETVFIANRVYNDKGFGPFYLFLVLELFAGLLSDRSIGQWLAVFMK